MSLTGEFPAQRPVTLSFDVLFDLHLNKRLSKQSWGWLFETPSGPLWRHCNVRSAQYKDVVLTLSNEHYQNLKTELSSITTYL